MYKYKLDDMEYISGQLRKGNICGLSLRWGCDGSLGCNFFINFLFKRGRIWNRYQVFFQFLFQIRCRIYRCSSCRFLFKRGRIWNQYRVFFQFLFQITCRIYRCSSCRFLFQRGGIRTANTWFSRRIFLSKSSDSMIAEEDDHLAKGEAQVIGQLLLLLTCRTLIGLKKIETISLFGKKRFTLFIPIL